jgi:hypothetical protein
VEKLSKIVYRVVALVAIVGYASSAVVVSPRMYVLARLRVL